jgi:alpha-glucosidase
MKAMFRTWGVLLVATGLAATAMAQTGPVKNVGNVNNTKINGQQVSLTTQNAFAEVTVYSPSVIRVRMDKQPLAADFSFAVISKPENSKANVSQDDSQITISTDSLRAVISKKPFAVAFYTPDGRIINQDEKGLGTSWVNESVTVYKHMQDGEHFVGLGQKRATSIGKVVAIVTGTRIHSVTVLIRTRYIQLFRFI